MDFCTPFPEERSAGGILWHGFAHCLQELSHPHVKAQVRFVSDRHFAPPLQLCANSCNHTQIPWRTFLHHALTFLDSSCSFFIIYRATFYTGVLWVGFDSYKLAKCFPFQAPDLWYLSVLPTLHLAGQNFAFLGLAPDGIFGLRG